MPARASAVPTAEAVAVWQQRAAGGDWDIGYAVLGRPEAEDKATALRWWVPGGGTAGVIARMPGDDENPHVAVAPGTTGDAIAVWEHHQPGGESEIAWSRGTGGAWASPVALATLPGDDVDPAVALDGRGGALAVWVNRSGGSDRLAWSLFSDGAWSPARVMPGRGRASLPEIAFLDAPAGGGDAYRAAAAYVDLDGSPAVHRTHVALWDGTAWSEPEAIPLEDDLLAAVPEHGWADYDRPLGAFSRVGLAPERGGGLAVLWSGPVAEDLHRRYDSRTIAGARRDPSGGWRAVRLADGSPALAGGCYSPDVVMTGDDDWVSVHASPGLLEYARAVDGPVTHAARSLDSSYDDARPSAAPLRDGVLSVSSGLAYPFDERSGAIVWSIGTLRPPFEEHQPFVTWDDARVLSLPADARYPEVASALGGTGSPLSIVKEGRAYAAGAPAAAPAGDTGMRSSSGDGDDRAPAAVVSQGIATLVAGEGRSTRAADTSVSTATIAEAVLHSEPRVVLRGVRVVAEAGCAFGSRGSVTIASVRVGDSPPVAVTARENMSVPVGALTLRINTQRRGHSDVTVRAAHLTGPGVDLVLGEAFAGVRGCVGSGPPVPSGPGHDGH